MIFADWALPELTKSSARNFSLVGGTDSPWAREQNDDWAKGFIWTALFSLDFLWAPNT